MTEDRPRSDAVWGPPIRLRWAGVATALVVSAVLVSGCAPAGDATAARDAAPSPSPSPSPPAASAGTSRDPAAGARAPAEDPTEVLRVRPGTQVRTTLTEAIHALRVADERDDGYDRELFEHWVDADGNGCDTRQEVLVTQNRAASARLTDDCTVLAGEWLSYYDQVRTTSASDFDVDHLVPLAEAWRSGARSWSPQRRAAFANDLGERRTLVAVSRVANQRKSDGDPSAWMPAHQSCVYVSSWVAVKVRWQLSVDRTERDTLLRYADGCGARRTTVRVARVLPSGATADARSSDAATVPYAAAPPPPAPPASEPATPDEGAGAGAVGVDPRFDYCTTAIEAGFGPYARDADPEYGWYRDNDSDGVVCES